jgi:O-antigen ligase
MTVALAQAGLARADAPLAAAAPHVNAALRGRPSLLAAATVLLVCLPLGNHDLSAGIHITPADLAGALLVLVVAARIVAGVPVRATAMWLLAAAALVACAVATLAAADTAASVTGFVRYAEVFVLLPMAVAVSLRDRIDIALVCGAVLVAGTIEGAVGAWQMVTRTGAAYGAQGLRAVGTFGAVDIMAMANVVACAVVVAVGLALRMRGRAGAALAILAAALVVPLLGSLSRGSWLATVVAITVMVLLVSLRLAAWLAIVAVAVAVMVPAAPAGEGADVRARIASVAATATNPDRSVSDRYELWRTAAAMWADHPVTGVGPHRFAALRDSYAPISLSSGSDTDDGHRFQRAPLLSPHSIYLLVLSEQGLLGALAFGALLTGIVIEAVRRGRRAVSARAGTGTAGTGAVAVAAAGLAAWHVVNFLYADIGGPSTVLIAVTLGIALWWVGMPEGTGEAR